MDEGSRLFTVSLLPDKFPRVFYIGGWIDSTGDFDAEKKR
jgi:hypothetical protein